MASSLSTIDSYHLWVQVTNDLDLDAWSHKLISTYIYSFPIIMNPFKDQHTNIS
jgi:hypothetical protein